MKVLIVDDSKVARMTIRQCLEKTDYEIIGEAQNGEEGIIKYKELNPDLVLLDIQMPIMDGIECLKAIIKYDKKAKVIMATAIGELESILTAVKEGAVGYITKTFKKGQLINAINKALKK